MSLDSLYYACRAGDVTDSISIADNALLPSDMNSPCTVNAKRHHMRTDTRWIKENMHVKGMYQYEGSSRMSMYSIGPVYRLRFV